MNNSIIIDFHNKKSEEEILSSPIFLEVIDQFLEKIRFSNKNLFYQLTQTFGENSCSSGLMSFSKKLTTTPYKELIDEYLPLTNSKENVLNVIDGFYDTWRNKERYGYIIKSSDISSKKFINRTEKFAQLILNVYRDAYENVLGGEQEVYRQLPSGINAGFILSSQKYNLPSCLDFLNKTKKVDSLLIRPPFICSSKENTRVGTFFYKDNKLQESEYNENDYFSVCILVKNELGYIFVHKDYLSFLVALGNLFHIVSFSKVKNMKPSFIVVFGANKKEELTYYYKQEGIYVGICPLEGKIGYFGYLKKIILTLFNLTMIEQGKLPIHGAGIEIVMHNHKTFNIVILGDSGAGKSETMEALKELGSDKIKSISTIFDDMGTFSFRDDLVVTSGTEIGAFVRLDDLPNGYSLSSVDRAIYINIDQVNSRVVIPIETYEFSKSLHKVDIFLLADNFTENKNGIIRYLDEEEAKEEFKKGERVAKGTTSEKGKVSSFFANPFGPVQKKESCSTLIDSYFSSLYKEKVFVGRLYTKLALDPINGPKIGAKAVLDLLIKLSEEN